MTFLQTLVKKMGFPKSKGNQISSEPYPWTLPENHRIYAVGDIHGCSHLLVNLLEQIHEDANGYSGQVTQLFLGDYVDRGPNSKRTLEILAAPPQFGHKRICLKGNHEEALLRSLTDCDFIEYWREFGAIETLLSFDLNPHLMISPDGRELLQQQLQDILNETPGILPFLENLPSFFELGDYYFVHAGVRPGFALSSQTDNDRLWIREDFLNHKKRFEKMIVHGHTPQEQVEIKDNRINLDTGAYATNILSCLVLERNTYRLLQTNQ